MQMLMQRIGSDPFSVFVFVSPLMHCDAAIDVNADGKCDQALDISSLFWRFL